MPAAIRGFNNGVFEVNPVQGGKPGIVYPQPQMDRRCPPEYAAKYYAKFGRFPTCPNAPPQPKPVMIVGPPPKQWRRRRHHHPRPMPPIRFDPLPMPPTPAPAPAGELCPNQGWTTRPCGDGYKVFACTPGQPVNINPALLCKPSALSGLLNDCGLGDCSDATIQSKIFSYADKYGIDRGIALAQIKQESGCRPSVCSTAGACGIAQFIPSTWAQYGGGGDRSDIDASLNAWGSYMRHLLDRFSGDYRLALAGYHAGEADAQAALNNPAGNPKTNQYVSIIMGAAGGSPSGGSPSVLGTLSPAIVLGLGGLLLVMAISR